MLIVKVKNTMFFFLLEKRNFTEICRRDRPRFSKIQSANLIKTVLVFVGNTFVNRFLSLTFSIYINVLWN